MVSSMTQRQIKAERMNLIQRLLTKPTSSYEIAKLTGFPIPSARKYVGELYDLGRIHISGWRFSERTTTALYLAGPGEDAAKPCRGTKHVEDEDEVFQRPSVVVHVRRDPLVAALFGAVA